MTFKNLISTIRVPIIYNSVSVFYCYFDSCQNSSLDGGCVFVSNSNNDLIVGYSYFYRGVGNYGGAIYSNVKSSKVFSSCFSNCTAMVHGSGVALRVQTNSILANEFNETSVGFCHAFNLASWIIYHGSCIVDKQNSTHCSSIVRESTGHYWVGRYSSTKYFSACNNSGVYVFTPYREISGESYHGFCNFVHNSPQLFVVFTYDTIGVNVIQNSIFIDNGIDKTCNSPCLSLRFENCQSDANIPVSNINCSTLISLELLITHNFNIIAPGNCQSTSTIYDSTFSYNRYPIQIILMFFITLSND